MAKIFPKVGDKIHFRKDLKVGEKYGGLNWLRDMDELPYLKDEVTVEEANVNTLRLKEDSDDIKWFFSREMFVEYTEDKQPERKQAMENKKMLTKYRAGDKVMVRGDLEIGEYYSGGNYTRNCVVEDMADFKGKVVTIARVCEDGEYELEEDGSPCAYEWTDGMFAYLAEPRYKVGDRVVVRKDLVIDEEYGLDKCGAECSFASGMEEYLGKTLTITYVNFGGNRWHRYHVKEDLGEWSWTDDMFEGLAEEPPVTEDKQPDNEAESEKPDDDDPKPKYAYKVGDKVRVRDDLKVDSVYGSEYFVSGMAWARGKVVTIYYAAPDKEMFHVEEDDGLFKYWFTPEMFAGIIEEPPVKEPMANLSADEESFDCSLAEECLFNGRVVCVESDNDSVIERGDMIAVKDGRFTWNGRKFDHVFGISGIIFGFNEVFDASVEFVRVMEES